ncbi:hypothetical protein GOODEAATRI_033297 [Goodea atripinnis]|uniref:Uncharacterized protein n=1 Tax=Goodea atripinnis TaxID=208336 RepID=A0ABV0MX76_9TELE
MLSQGVGQHLNVGSDPKAIRRSLTGLAVLLCESRLGSVEKVLGPGLYSWQNWLIAVFCWKPFTALRCFPVFECDFNARTPFVPTDEVVRLWYNSNETRANYTKAACWSL